VCRARGSDCRTSGQRTSSSPQRALSEDDRPEACENEKTREDLGVSECYTVFVFSGDGKNVDNCQTIPGCTNVWVPMTFGGKKPINPATLGVGPGLKQSLLSSVAMDANYFNTPQATYNGYPLYTNAKDVVQADTKYVGESADGGKWYALNAAGHVVK